MSAKPANPFRKAQFLTSANKLGQLPPDTGNEVAFAGRSNAGKSSALNAICDQQGLARTSKTPGRTQLLNVFPVADPAKRLIDLPGYGYAKVSQAERRAWQPLIEGYTRTRSALALFVVLIDARRGIEDEERQLYEWLGTENVPAQIVFTKVDKLNASARGLLRERARASFRGGRRAGGPIMTSGETGEGVDALWAAIFDAVRALPAVAPELAEPTRRA